MPSGDVVPMADVVSLICATAGPPMMTAGTEAKTASLMKRFCVNDMTVLLFIVVPHEFVPFLRQHA